MKLEQSQVAEFMRAFGFAVASEPIWPKPEDIERRMRVIREEVQELEDAVSQLELAEMFPNEAAPSLVPVADALGDILYGLLGAACSFGIDLSEVFQEIHRSNMTKLWSEEPHVRLRGHKILRPPGYQPPKFNI